MMEDLESNILEPMTQKQKSFLEHLMKVVYQPTEVWEQVMGEFKTDKYENVMNLTKEQASKLIGILVEMKEVINND